MSAARKHAAYELLIFDLGGVVVEVESDRLVLQVAQTIGRSFEEVQEIVYHRELLLPFELGRITPQAYFQGLKERLKLSWTYAQFVRAWNGIFSENESIGPKCGILMTTCVRATRASSVIARSKSEKGMCSSTSNAQTTSNE